MEYWGIILLSLIAGWIVNWVANTLPSRAPFWQNWASPLQHLTGTAGSASNGSQEVMPARPVRHIFVWLVATGLGWLAYARWGGQLTSWLLALEAWSFLAVAVIDLEHRRVLNRMLLPMAVSIAVINLWAGTPALQSALLGALTGFGLFLLLALIKPGAMGMGDVKLAGVIGLAVGLHGALLALLVSIYAGGLVAVVILLTRRLRRGQTMAYAPYLVLGAWVAIYFGPDLWPLYRL